MLGAIDQLDANRAILFHQNLCHPCAIVHLTTQLAITARHPLGQIQRTANRIAGHLDGAEPEAAVGELIEGGGGGEPASRRDLAEIVTAAHRAGLYSNLITSGVGLTAPRLKELADSGLDHVQVSIQDAQPASADRIAGYEGAFARKQGVAAETVRQLGLPPDRVLAVTMPGYATSGETRGNAWRLMRDRVVLRHARFDSLPED